MTSIKFHKPQFFINQPIIISKIKTWEYWLIHDFAKLEYSPLFDKEKVLPIEDLDHILSFDDKKELLDHCDEFIFQATKAVKNLEIDIANCKTLRLSLNSNKL